VARAPLVPRPRTACVIVAALLASADAAAQDHSQHQHQPNPPTAPAPAAAQDHARHQHQSATPATPSTRARGDAGLPDSARTPIAVRAEFVSGPVGATGTVLERQELEVRVRLTDPATGRPITGLEPMAWVDVRSDGQTSMAACQQRVGAFVEATLHVKHGEINVTQPVDDLNGHYIVALARGGTLVVIDPVKGFGRTRMLTAVPLGAEGADWASTPDDRRIFVALPTRGEVAVVNVHTWKVEARIPAGARPTRVRMQPGARRLWVTDDEAGVVVIDTDRLAVVASIPVGPGPHALDFTSDGATAFVAARRAGRVAVIDAGTLSIRRQVQTGVGPVDVAWSSGRGAAFVADEADGSLTVIDPNGQTVDRVALAPGIRSIRFAPDASSGEHAGHGGHGDGGAGGRLAFILNPLTGTLQIYDGVEKRVVRTLSGAPQPDQVAFTGTFAYIRAAGTPSVALIPLARPTSGATGPHDYFAAGGIAPGAVLADSLGDVLVPQPGMHDAIYAVNPAERMVYSYHYMEGMPVPHGGLTTYGFTPRSVRVVSRRVRETEPGVYAATLRIDRPGDYDLIFRSPEPYLLGCYGFSVARDSSLHSARDLRVAADTAELRTGRQTVRFRVSGARDGVPVADLADLRVQMASTDGWVRRAPAAAVGGGLYEAEFEIPSAGVYFASFEIPSRGVALRDLPPAALRVQP
jgi:YVTN family beta-propeller protein